MTPTLGERLAEVDSRIDAALHAAGRSPAQITRIVVTKYHPVSLVEQLYALGVRDVGENRQQELTAKRSAVHHDDLTWHAIGQIQTNKARLVRDSADVIHTIDRSRLIAALEAEAASTPTDVLLQVNLTDDPARGGVVPTQLEPLAERVLSSPSLRLRGLMGVAPLGESATAAFVRLAALAERLRAIAPEAVWLSAGMSADFEEAISIGATHLRIGSAITGPRPLAG